MSYLYFKFNRKENVLSEIVLKQNVKHRVVVPRLNNFHNISWYLFSLGRFREYQIVSSDNRILTKVQVMPKIFIFDFMKNGGIHVGPGSTIEESRGNGYLPFILRQIILDYKNTAVFYAFCVTDNISSRRGMEKVGFKLYARGVKRFKRYVIEEYL